jgi:hypothetical protein
LGAFFWNSDPNAVGPPGPPAPGPGGVPGGVNHGPRWMGPPFRVGGAYGVPPPFQATQDWLMAQQGHAPTAGANPGAGAGWSVTGTHSPLTNVGNGTGGTGAGNFGGGPTGPPIPAPGTGTAPPWWQAFQQYAGQRFPWLRGLGAGGGGAQNWFGPPPTVNPPTTGPYGTGTPGGMGGGAHGAY